ncbi:MAG: T9SS type A sorting domain-containing protein [Saprospiraceae bacterium]|nr:T9SS type A sorting domain-containing protein [Saprospiraceae bacterium]
MKTKLLFLTFTISLLSQISSFGQVGSPINFTWEGAATGNKAVWAVDDSIRIYSNINGVNVKLEIIDPFKKNTTTNNPSDYGDYTKTNSFYGPGTLSYQISASQSRQAVCLAFTFSEPVKLNRFTIYDIDMIHSIALPFGSFQDSIQFFGYADTGRVALDILPVGPSPVFDIFGQGLRAKYIFGSTGIKHTDVNGAINISTTKPILRFNLCYSNGSEDDGKSNSQAIKIKDFEFEKAFSPLPVTLVSMQTKWEGPGLAALSWEVAQEINNEAFEVLLSDDGKTYKSVGVIKSAGNGRGRHNYEYVFDNDIKGISYVALQQKDFDGRTSLLGVKTMKTSESDVDIKVYPNPVSDVLFIESSGTAEGLISYTILDMKGSIVLKGNFTGFGNDRKDIDISKLPSGNYAVQVSCDGKITNQKVMKL